MGAAQASLTVTKPVPSWEGGTCSSSRLTPVQEQQHTHFSIPFSPGSFGWVNLDKFLHLVLDRVGGLCPLSQPSPCGWSRLVGVYCPSSLCALLYTPLPHLAKPRALCRARQAPRSWRVNRDLQVLIAASKGKAPSTAGPQGKTPAILT